MRYTVILSAKGHSPRTLSVEAKTDEAAKIKAVNRWLSEQTELHPFDVKVVRIAPPAGDPVQLAKRVAQIAGRDPAKKSQE